MRAIFFSLLLSISARAQLVPPPVIAPPPTQEDLTRRTSRALAADGRAKKITALVLMVLGGAQVAAGAPWLGVAAGLPQSTERNQMIVIGLPLLMFGIAETAIGAPLYVSGGRNMRDAEKRLELTASGIRLSF